MYIYITRDRAGRFRSSISRTNFTTRGSDGRMPSSCIRCRT